jgi:hypothetical protein
MLLFPLDKFTESQSVDINELKNDDPKQLAKFVAQCVTDSDQWRNQFSVMSDNSSWILDANKYEDLYNGHLYSKRKKLPYECKEDIYAEAVDFNATLLTQFEVKDYVRKTTEEDQSLDAEIMTRVQNYCMLELNHGKEKEEDMLRLAGQMGNGIYKFQPMMTESGVVWPGHEVCDTRQIGISPRATSPDDALYMFHRRPVPTYELQEKFPQFKDAIKSDADVSDSFNTSNNDGSVYIDGLGTAAFLGMGRMMSWLTGKNGRQQTILTEFYFRDPTITELKSIEDITTWVKMNPGFGSAYFQPKVIAQYAKQLSDNGGQPLRVKKYPYGRKILTTKDITLSDVPNPYPFFPFPTFKCYRRPKAFWAKGVIEKMREPAQNIQLVSAGLAANADYRLRPTYYHQGNLAAKATKVPTEPNEMISTPGEIRAIPVPPVLPQDMMALINYREQKMQNTTGLQPILSGANVSGNYSGIQTNALIEQALGKVAPRFRDFVRCKKALGGMYLWFLRNYCTDERMIVFMTDSEKKNATDKIVLNQAQVVGNAPITGNDVTKGEYEYVVDENVSQPATPSQRFAQIQGISKIFAPFAPIAAARMQIAAAPIPDKSKYIDMFDQAIASKQEQEMQMRMMQMQQTNTQMEIARNERERELDTKEILAGAKAQEAMAWVIKTLTDAGQIIPPNVMAELNTIAQTTQAESSQAAIQAIPAPPPQTPQQRLPNG